MAIVIEGISSRLQLSRGDKHLSWFSGCTSVTHLAVADSFLTEGGCGRVFTNFFSSPRINEYICPSDDHWKMVITLILLQLLLCLDFIIHFRIFKVPHCSIIMVLQIIRGVAPSSSSIYSFLQYKCSWCHGTEIVFRWYDAFGNLAYFIQKFQRPVKIQSKLRSHGPSATWTGTPFWLN